MITVWGLNDVGIAGRVNFRPDISLDRCHSRDV